MTLLFIVAIFVFVVIAAVILKIIVITHKSFIINFYVQFTQHST